MKYRCLVIDPPWDQGKTGKRIQDPDTYSSDLDYRTMTQHDLLNLPVDEWADENCWMWLWVTMSRSQSSKRPILQQGLDLMESWGFRYYTMITWDKRNGPVPFGPYQISTEHVLFGFRGKADFPKESLGKMQTCFHAPPREHSRKPDIFYENIARYFPGPRLDVFARRIHPGFDGWGDEYEGLDYDPFV